MSHKHKHNYSNYSKPQEAPVVEPEVKVEETTEPETDDSVIGIVTGCAKLNVREGAAVNAAVLTTIPEGSEVQIDILDSTDEFYKVCTATGVEGFCMKKFINIEA